MKPITLYKKSNRGLEQWTIETVNKSRMSIIKVTWGVLGGKLQEKDTIINEGKNIGKSNETSISAQAELEALSTIEKQKDKGYFDTLEQAQKTRKIRPMLAKVYGDHKHKVKFPGFIQPKLDGTRCLTNLSTLKMVSRKGKLVETMSHIKEELEHISRKYPNLILDGELYKHGEGFQTLISAIKRDEANEKSKEIEYHIYDCFSLKENFNFNKRIGFLHDIKTIIPNRKSIQIVETWICNNEEEIFSFHEKFLQQGYEGSIIRNNTSYEIDKRTHNLLKLKEFKDDEFKIIGFSEDKNGHVVFELVTLGGEVFKAKPEGTDEERKQMLKNAPNLIGEMATVKYFEMSDKEVPRFPTIKSIRNYE